MALLGEKGAKAPFFCWFWAPPLTSLVRGLRSSGPGLPEDVLGIGTKGVGSNEKTYLYGEKNI